MNKGGKHEPGSCQDSQVKCLLALIWSKPLGLLQKGFCRWLFWDQAVMWEFSCVKTCLNWLSLLDIHVFALNANLFLTGFHWRFFFFDKGILNVLGKVLYAEKGNVKCLVLPYFCIFVTEDARELAVWYQESDPTWTPRKTCNFCRIFYLLSHLVS